MSQLCPRPIADDHEHVVADLGDHPSKSRRGSHVVRLARRARRNQSHFLNSATVIGMMRRLCLSYSAMRSVLLPYERGGWVYAE